MSMPADLRAAALSDRGRRRASNEDAFVLRPERGLLLVSDGLGGHRAGETASAAVVAVLPAMLEARLDAPGPGPAPVAEVLRDAVVELSGELRRQSEGDAEIAGLGATVAFALFRGEDAWVVHMGDSRVYRLRGDRFETLTEDHSLAALLVRRGELSPEEAGDHPEFAGLTRYVGMEGVVYPDVRPERPEPGDRYLLCTDGLTAMVEDGRVAELLRRGPSPLDACRALVDAANEAGGRDNVTVIVGTGDGPGDPGRRKGPIAARPSRSRSTIRSSSAATRTATPTSRPRTPPPRATISSSR